MNYKKESLKYQLAQKNKQLKLLKKVSFLLWVQKYIEMVLDLGLNMQIRALKKLKSLHIELYEVSYDRNYLVTVEKLDETIKMLEGAHE